MNEDSSYTPLISEYIKRFREQKPTSQAERQSIKGGKKSFWWMSPDENGDINSDSKNDNRLNLNIASRDFVASQRRILEETIETLNPDDLDDHTNKLLQRCDAILGEYNVGLNQNIPIRNEKDEEEAKGNRLGAKNRTMTAAAKSTMPYLPSSLATPLVVAQSIDEGNDGTPPTPPPLHVSPEPQQYQQHHQQRPTSKVGPANNSSSSPMIDSINNTSGIFSMLSATTVDDDDYIKEKASRFRPSTAPHNDSATKHDNGMVSHPRAPASVPSAFTSPALTPPHISGSCAKFNPTAIAAASTANNAVPDELAMMTKSIDALPVMASLEDFTFSSQEGGDYDNLLQFGDVDKTERTTLPVLACSKDRDCHTSNDNKYQYKAQQHKHVSQDSTSDTPPAAAAAPLSRANVVDIALVRPFLGDDIVAHLWNRLVTVRKKIAECNSLPPPPPPPPSSAAAAAVANLMPSSSTSTEPHSPSTLLTQQLYAVNDLLSSKLDVTVKLYRESTRLAAASPLLLQQLQATNKMLASKLQEYTRKSTVDRAICNSKIASSSFSSTFSSDSDPNHKDHLTPSSLLIQQLQAVSSLLSEKLASTGARYKQSFDYFQHMSSPLLLQELQASNLLSRQEQQQQQQSVGPPSDLYLYRRPEPSGRDPSQFVPSSLLLQQLQAVNHLLDDKLTKSTELNLKSMRSAVFC